jgi:hypothetical protein
MHTALTQQGQMKIHFYNPNPVIFQKKHLNDVEVQNFFFHFQVHITIMFFYKKTFKTMDLKKSI